ncbi:paraquat-inducible protein A [Rhizobiales bacterium]|uniref:paraquat-inducible protein A n=1 Tax=Hongsoonwoonella zoysiae TaxID=2821844 RepID=UPI00155FD483|nr:paraquat-inducible protein A [Hongsoonwoonella zoysiae]NRG17422.1 paraquat-inducible protein A [Hongsoonwoonella zoysiae]
MRFVLAILLPLATGCFVLGLVLPLMKMERLYFLEDKPSLLEIVSGLWSGGDTLLASVVATFSILFPALKLFGLHMAVLGTSARLPLSMLAALGKWSMMDVMLVALVVFAAKTSGLATAAVLPGLWLYGAATLLTAASAAIARRV